MPTATKPKTVTATLFYIDGCLAMTHAERFVGTFQHEPTDDRKRHWFQWRPPRKRKDRRIMCDNGDYFLITGDAPFKCDTEFRNTTMHGNACFNLVGDRDAIREATAGLPDVVRSKMLVCADPVLTAGKVRRVWPEIETTHAVIQRYE